MTDNLTGISKEIRDVLLKGVYNDTFAIMYNGGPEWAKESTLGFKYMLSLRLIPWYIAGAYMFYRFLKTADARNSIRPHPSMLERLMGIIWFICIFIQIYLKIHTKTLIFILNPCHVITLVWGIVLSINYSKTAQVLFLYAMSNVFNAYIGMIFAENDELESDMEVISYWVQHSIAAFFAPLVCLLSGRFAHKIYSNPFIILVGYQMFTLYMRLFLTPISALTWANLNHTLWGIDNDPWRKYFQLKEYFYFWAEFYLGLASVTFSLFDIWVARLLCPGLFNKNEAIEGKIKND
jgi:hypothetical protein